MTDTTQRLQRHAALLILTALTLLVHGYHPFAEDGGLYVAGIQSTLDPTLFPHDLPFVTATLHYSLFAPVMATIVRASHIPLPWLLLLVNLVGIWLLLYAALRIAAQCTISTRAQLASVALLAAWFTLPIAGTSLLLMDPYVTARTLSTPLSLLAIPFALQRRSRSYLLCLAAAATFHPLMTAYAAAFILILLTTSRTRLILAAAAVVIAALLQVNAAPESTATIAAAFSRYYWFLSQWQWFELLGLAGPLIVFALLLRFSRLTPAASALSRAAITLGLIATFVTLLFAQQHFATHLVARLQPLRAFLLLYALMIILLGATIAQLSTTRARLSTAVLFIASMAAVMHYVQRETFLASQHIELPNQPPANPWSQAFLWARNNTPTDALFAIDANYIITNGEDGQTFRATAQRSIVPDFSKDGGEAAIRPSLSDSWFVGQQAQKNLSQLTDIQRRQRLQPFAATWIILHANATTDLPCPYKNAVVKVCSL